MRKKIFSYNNDINKTAYLNWQTYDRQPIHNMNVLAEGYRNASICLIEKCLENNEDKKADTLIFPILFSINQGIELYEKALCWSVNILLGIRASYTHNHDIRGEWFNVKNKIKQFGFEISGSDEEEFNKMIKPLEEYLEEIMSTIDMDGNINKAYYNIDFTRFPLNNRDQRQFYIDSFKNVVVDLEYLNNITKEIFECLDRLSGYYYELVLEKWNCE